jgi:hypothetical protein
MLMAREESGECGGIAVEEACGFGEVAMRSSNINSMRMCELTAAMQAKVQVCG